jgi:hypothetical protein
MKKLTHINSIVFLFGIILFSGCKSKEQNIAPITIAPIIFNYLEDRLSIKNFTIKNAKIEFPKESNSQTNFLILTLPEDYKEDFIIPEINLLGYAKEISPKSGEKVFFEGKKAIEYTLTKIDGSQIKFLVYVKRQGSIDVELFTKEIILNSDLKLSIKLKVKNVGTVGTDNAYSSNGIPLLKIYDSDKKEVYSSWNLEIKGDTASLNLLNSYNMVNPKGYNFLKKGNYTVKVVIDTDSVNTRKSSEYNLNIVNGNKSFIYPSNSFSYIWIINTDMEIKGVNFDKNKSYKLYFESDFTTPILLSTKYIDENTLTAKIPNDIDESQYKISFQENDITVINQKGFVAEKPFDILNSINFYRAENSWSLIDEKSPFTISKNQVFGYAVYGYGVNLGEAYTKGDLKLVDIKNRKTYVLEGKLIRGIWGGIASIWTFNLSENNIPQGFYEIYILNGQYNTSRYFRKLEVK